MACFIVPATEAIISTVAKKVIESREKNEICGAVSVENSVEISKIKFSTKLGWLNKLLWGGSALLAFEHLWHGEISPVFPFLTAVQNGETAGMLNEMGTTGVAMTVVVTLAWVGMLAFSSALEKKSEKTETDIRA